MLAQLDFPTVLSGLALLVSSLSLWFTLVRERRARVMDVTTRKNEVLRDLDREGTAIRQTMGLLRFAARLTGDDETLKDCYKKMLGMMREHEELVEQVRQYKAKRVSRVRARLLFEEFAGECERQLRRAEHAREATEKYFETLLKQRAAGAGARS